MSTNASTYFTRIMLVVVCALGTLSIVNLLNEPMQTDPEDPIVQSNIFATSRGLASVAVTGETMTAVSPTVDVVDLECNSESQSIQTTSTRIRVKGTSCLVVQADNRQPAPEPTVVKNNSNGFVATVFHRGPASFTTDYINLNEGQNEIEVMFQTAQGPVQKKLSIIRKANP